MSGPTGSRLYVAIVLDRAYENCVYVLRDLLEEHSESELPTLYPFRTAARKITNTRRAIRWFESEYNMLQRDFYEERSARQASKEMRS